MKSYPLENQGVTFCYLLSVRQLCSSHKCAGPVVWHTAAYCAKPTEAQRRA